MRLSKMIMGAANIADIIVGEAITKTASALGAGVVKATGTYLEHKDAVEINALSEILEFNELNDESIILSKRVSYILKIIQEHGIVVEKAPKLFVNNRFTFKLYGNKLFIREHIMGNGFTGAVILKDKNHKRSTLLDDDITSFQFAEQALENKIFQKAVSRAILKDHIDETIKRYSLTDNEASDLRNKARSILGKKNVKLIISQSVESKKIEHKNDTFIDYAEQRSKEIEAALSQYKT